MFGRLGNLIKGFFGLFVSDLERSNPEALLENEKENLRAHIVKFNAGLVTHAALCERLIQQVGNLENEETELRARTKGLIKMGNQKVAGETALRLQALTRELGENRKQAESAESTYKELIRSRDASVETARKRIEKLKRNIDDLRIQQAVADLNQMAAGLVTSIGGTGDTLQRLEEIVSEEHAQARGTSRVAHDELNMEEVAVQEATQEALAEQALADFAAAEGISLEESASTEESAEVSKTMGPTETN